MLKWLALLWVFLLPVQIYMGRRFLIPRFAPSDVVLILYLPLFLSQGIGRMKRFAHKSHLWLFVVFLLGIFIFYINTGEISRWALWNKTLGLVVLTLIYAMIGNYASEGWERVNQLIRFFIRVVTLHALIAIVIMATGTSEKFHANWSGGLRLAGFMIDPNAFGSLLASAFVIAFALYFGKGALYNRIEGVVTCSILGLGVFLTYSRSAWIGMALGTIAVVLLGRGTYRVRNVMVILLVALTGYYLIPIVLKGVSTENPWKYSEFFAWRQGTVEGRIDANQVAMEMFTQSPVWGKGLGFFDYATEGYGIVHNTFIWFLVEVGILGLGVFIWFLIAHLQKGWVNLKHSAELFFPSNLGLLAGFVTLTGLSVGIEALNQRHWWFIMALISSAWYLTRNNVNTLPRRIR